jgi:hypothetical protein
VWGAIVGRMKTVGLRKTTLCVQKKKKKCKIASYIMKYPLSHIRTPFLFERKVTCPQFFLF